MTGSRNKNDPPDDGLSPKAREVKERLERGEYRVDIEGLAQRILDEGALDESDDEEPDDSSTAPAKVIPLHSPERGDE